MQVLVHVAVLEGIVCGFLGRGDGGVEVLQLAGEAHAYFERVRHRSFRIGAFTRTHRGDIKVLGGEQRQWRGVSPLTREALMLGTRLRAAAAMVGREEAWPCMPPGPVQAAI